MIGVAHPGRERVMQKENPGSEIGWGFFMLTLP